MEDQEKGHDQQFFFVLFVPFCSKSVSSLLAVNSG
jgi:hypothetical protein